MIAVVRRYATVALLLAWSAATVAALPTTFSNGWHTWQVDNGGDLVVYIKFADGVPTKIHTQDGSCCGKPSGSMQDHGTVSATENYHWFREIVERRNLQDDVRAGALFGLAQSNTDEAYAYLDQIILGSN